MKTVKVKSILLCAAFYALLLAAASVSTLSTVYASGEHQHAQKDPHSHGHDKKTNADSHVNDAHNDSHEDTHEQADEHAEGEIHLSEEQIKAAGINIAPVSGGMLAKEITVPAKITAAADKLAQIVPKASGIVADARKNIGDTVEKGDVMALIESREMAEAIADYLAAKRSEDLARMTFNREKSLWQKKITAEQDFLNAQNAYEESSIRLDLTRQKLQALGHDDVKTGKGNTRFHELRAPIAGRVINRELTLGEYVDTSRAAYTIADLSVLWVETSISAADIALVHEGQIATINGNAGQAAAKVIFVSPAMSSGTQTAKAIIELHNPDGRWRAGDFATAIIATSAAPAPTIIPKDALQTIEGKKAVFVRTAKGFEKRDIQTGLADSEKVEVISGLSAGENIAVSNTFTLKAELGKSEAGHEH